MEPALQIKVEMVVTQLKTQVVAVVVLLRLELMD